MTSPKQDNCSGQPVSRRPRFRSAWRVDVENRRATLAVLLECAKTGPRDECTEARLTGAAARLAAVEEVLNERPGLLHRLAGADVDRAWVNLHEAEAILLELGEPRDLIGELPRLRALAKRTLKADDPELGKLDELGTKSAQLDLTDRGTIANTLRSAYRAAAEQHRRLRSFRNILLASTAVLFVVGLLLGLLGALQPASLNLCFTVPAGGPGGCPTGRPTPSGGDMALVELLGVFGALLVGARTVHRMRGTSTPYAVPMASLLLKLPTGALTAVGGILLLKAGFAPGISALSGDEVKAYAILFGSAQQAFTHLVDRQTQNVMNSVGSVGSDNARPKDDQPPPGPPA